MRLLVIPDIHNKILRAEALIKAVPHDRCILLGDYFDSHGETTDMAKNTALWLKNFVLPNPKIVPLMGNHDVSYIFRNNAYFRCSGYSDYKNLTIDSILTAEEKDKFKVYHIDQGFVFSHAGLTNPFWKELSLKFEEGDKPRLEFFDEVLSYNVELSINNAKNNRAAELFGAGWDRRGFQRHGGITWTDWDNFAPVKGINQVVGHTIGHLPRFLVQRTGGGYINKNITFLRDDDVLTNKVKKYLVNGDKNHILSVSFCLDTCLNSYAVVEDGDIAVYDWDTQLDYYQLNEYFIPESPLNRLT